MNAQQRRALVDQQSKYDKLDIFAYCELICRANPKTKNRTKAGNFNPAFDFLQSENIIDEMARAAQLMHNHSLQQLEGKFGAKFVDREQCEFLAFA